MSLASMQVPTSPLMRETEQFFRRLEHSSRGLRLLAENNHRIEFDLDDGAPFWIDVRGGQIAVHAGTVEPMVFDDPELIHLRLRTSTLRRLLRGEIRFTDGLIPTVENTTDAILLLECTLFKWSVLSWIGRMVRTAQITNAAA